MHVFLTGALQVGKSTLVRRVIAALDCRVDGYQTFFVGDRSLPDKALYLRGILEPREADEGCVVVRFVDGRPAAYADRFDALGGGRLRRAGVGAELIVMDECGRLERDAREFQAEVLRTLDGDTPVLGVVRQDAGGWTEAIHAHPKVRVMTVTEENRDALVQELLAHYRAMP